MPGKGGEVVTR